MIFNLLVSSAIRSGIVLAAGLLACAMLARASASTRRAVLVCTLGASLVVPLVAAVGPSWHFEAPRAFAVLAHESPLEGAAVGGGVSTTTPAQAPAPVAANAVSRIDAPGAAVALWFGGIVVVLARAIGSLRRARALVRESVPVSHDGWGDVVARTARETGATADVRLSRDVDSPAVTGVVHATVLFPTSADAWPDERKRVVLVHELAHVRRRDGVAQIVADVACAVSWFNPLAWICAQRLRVERELAADDSVLAAGVRPSSYAEELVALAGGEARGALAMAERSSLGNRVVAILAAKRARNALAARGTTLLVAGGVVVGAVAACSSPEAPMHDSAATSGAKPGVGESIDASFQRSAETELATVAKDATAEMATIVVLDAATGEILADAGQKGGHTLDVAQTQAMSPGSTLKVVTLAAAVETGAITPGQMFDCGPKSRTYPGGDLHDAHESGTLDAPHLVAVSSNIGISRIFDAVGGDRYGQWLGRFHFGEAPGAVPATITTGTLAGATVAIGEGITATPLQIAAAYAALANDGVYHAPTLAHAASPAERIMTPATAKQVVAMLELVVNDETGTGKLARIDGLHVVGKTGTSEWTASDGRQHIYASFVGITDVAGRRIVALVGAETLRDDVWGGNVAAPAFARLVSRLR